MSAYARSALLLMTPSTFRRRNTDHKRPSAVTTTTKNHEKDAPSETLFDAANGTTSGILLPAKRSSYRWNSASKLQREIDAPTSRLASNQKRQMPPSSCIAFQEGDSQQSTSMQHPPLSQLTMSQLSDAGKSLSQRSGTQSVLSTGMSSPRRGSSHDRRRIGIHSHRPSWGVRYNRPSVAEGVAPNRSLRNIRQNETSSSTNNPGNMFFSQCSQQSDGDNTMTRKSLSNSHDNREKPVMSSTSASDECGNRNHRNKDIGTTSNRSTPYNLESRLDFSWRRRSHTSSGTAGCTSPKHTQGSNHTSYPSQHSCISLLEQDSQQQQDFTENLKSQPLLPGADGGPFLLSRPTTSSCSKTHHHHHHVHEQAFFHDGAQISSSVNKKRSWMEACVDIIATPYRRNKKTKKNGTSSDCTSGVNSLAQDHEKDAKGATDGNSDSSSGKMPENEQVDLVSSNLASQVLTTFQTPARSHNMIPHGINTGTHTNNKSLGPSKFGEKVTPSPGNDTASRKVSLAQQNLLKEKEELTKLLEQIKRDEETRRKELEEIISTKKDAMLQEIQQASDSLEKVLSKARTLEQNLSDNIDLLRKQEKETIQSLQTIGSNERDGIQKRCDELLAGITQKEESVMTNQLQCLQREKEDVLGLFKSAIEGVSTEVKKEITELANIECDRMKKFMDEVRNERQLYISKRQCEDSHSIGSCPMAANMPPPSNTVTSMTKINPNAALVASKLNNESRVETLAADEGEVNKNLKVCRTRKKLPRACNMQKENKSHAPVQSVQIQSNANDLNISPLSSKSREGNNDRDACPRAKSGTRMEGKNDMILEENHVSNSRNNQKNKIPKKVYKHDLKSSRGMDDNIPSDSEDGALNVFESDSNPATQTQAKLHGTQLRQNSASPHQNVEKENTSQTSSSHFPLIANFEKKSKMQAPSSPDKNTPIMLIRKELVSEPPAARGRRKKRTYQRLHSRKCSGDIYHYTSKRTLLGNICLSNLNISENKCILDSPPLFTKSMYEQEVLDGDKVLSAPPIPDFDESRSCGTKRKTLPRRSRPHLFSDVDSSRGEDVFEFM